MTNAWHVKELQPNVHRIVFEDVREGWEQYILLTADRHHDSPKAARKLERLHLEMALERNAPIIDIGDLFDAMQGREDRRRSKLESRPEDATKDNYFDMLVDGAERFYGPYAHLFAVLGIGNHETAVTKHAGTDMTYRLARRLRESGGKAWPYRGGYGGYVKMRFVMHGSKYQNMNIKYFHGSGGGGPVTKGVIQTNRRAIQFPDADMIISGHIHEGWIVVAATREKINSQGTLSKNNQIHISIPSYKDDYGDGSEGWAVEKGMPPKPVGCVWLRCFYHNRKVRIQPDLDVY